MYAKKIFQFPQRSEIYTKSKVTVSRKPEIGRQRDIVPES